MDKAAAKTKKVVRWADEEASAYLMARGKRTTVAPAAKHMAQASPRATRGAIAKAPKGATSRSQRRKARESVRAVLEEVERAKDRDIVGAPADAQAMEPTAPLPDAGGKLLSPLSVSSVAGPNTRKACPLKTNSLVPYHPFRCTSRRAHFAT